LGALVYRWLVSIWIALWVSAKSLPLAAVLGCWFLFTLVAKPIASAARFLATAPQLARERARAIGISVAALASIVISVFWVPVPSWTLAQGVVWLPDDARIRTGTEGFVKEVLVRDGETVRVGQPLIVLEAPDLVARQAELTAQLERLEAQYQHSLGSSPGEASAAEQARDQAQAELTRINQRLGELRIDSPVEGTLAMPYQEDLRESFVQRGAVLAHVMTNASLQVRVAVPHSDAALIRDRHEHIEVRLAEQPANPANAHLLREVPAATNILPAAALSDRFGGSITTDPQDPEAVHTLEPFFLFDITVPSERFQRAGARAWVRIDHGREPLAAQWGRSLRRMMLRHFSVQS
jgi:putative peptide zinc metalloprotease protein